MEKLGGFLEAKRKEARLSLRAASQMSGISHTHIRDIEKGNSAPSFEMVMKFLEAYSVELEEFLRETGHAPFNVHPADSKTKQVPIISWTQAGNWREIGNSPKDDYDYVEAGSKGVFALMVRGDSMESEFHDGDIIIVNPHLKPDHNDFVVVCNEEWEATFKQLKKYGRTRVLHPLNQKYDDIELKKNTEYRILGVITEKKKKYK